MVISIMYDHNHHCDCCCFVIDKYAILHLLLNLPPLLWRIDSETEVLTFLLIRLSSETTQVESKNTFIRERIIMNSIISDIKASVVCIFIISSNSSRGDDVYNRKIRRYN